MIASESSPEVRDTIDSRLDAYAKARSQLIGSRWDQASIRNIAEDTIGQIAGGRISLSGPHNIEVPSKVALAISMAFYELATNAVKHGSLSVPDGSVSLTWDYLADDKTSLSIDWKELDGPVPVEPTSKGFGSRIIGTVLAMETYGEVRMDYPKTGFTWSLGMPLKG